MPKVKAPKDVGKYTWDVFTVVKPKKKADLTYREKVAVLLDWDEGAHPRDDHGRFGAGGVGEGKFAESNARDYKRLALQDQLGKLVPGPVIIREPTPNLIATGEAVAKVLTAMQGEGIEMPHSITIGHVDDAGGVRAQVEGWVTKEGDKVVRVQKDLHVEIPSTLPQGANLDDAVAAVFNKPSEVNPKHAYNDHEYDHYDKFAARSMRDVIVHEMGHVQAGHRGNIPYADLLQRGTFRNMDAIHRAGMRVSEYAHKNADEFIGEAYLRMSRGETLAEDSQKLYDALDGPKVQTIWMDQKGKP